MDPVMDFLLAHHCGPALAGIKPAALFSFSPADFPQPERMVAEYTRLLKARGICLEALCHCGRRTLLLVYRKEKLAAQLSRRAVLALLAEAGYPATDDHSLLLGHLRRRLSHGGFPHEIGLFLGYPPEDVVGFQRHQGRNFLFCGYWKVYSNPQGARSLFLRYDRCRRALCRRVARGEPLCQVFPAA